MDLHIKTHGTRISPELREYIEKRVEKLDRINERIIEAKFELREETHHNPNQRFIAQFTIATPRAVLRAEEKSSTDLAAIDLVTDKMSRQIRRFHDRKLRRTRHAPVNLGVLAADQSATSDESVDDVDRDAPIVRTKRFRVQPMDVDEAIEQIELLGHDFFVYYDVDSNRMNVLYRRKDDTYGVIEPELA